MPKHFSKLLQRAFLGGIVKECVLEEEEPGFFYVQAVDMSSSVFLDVSTRSSIRDISKCGIGDLGVLVKFVEQHCDTEGLTLTRSNNRLVISAASHGKIKYLLAEPEAIATTVRDPETMVRLMGACTHVVNITAENVRDLLGLINTIKPSGVSISIDEEGNVAFKGGLESEHQLELPIAKAVALPGQSGAVPTGRRGRSGGGSGFNVSVYPNHLSAVFNVLDFQPNPEPEGWQGCQILMAPDRPIIVRQDDDNLWALTPVEVVNG